MIERFDPLRPCPKCAGVNIGSRHHSGRNWGSPCGYLSKVNDEIAENHIHRTCRQCFYEWLELPLDFESSRLDAEKE